MDLEFLLFERPGYELVNGEFGKKILKSIKLMYVILFAFFV